MSNPAAAIAAAVSRAGWQPRGELGPQPAAVRELEQRPLRPALRDDVLVEAQLAAGAQDTADLRERARLVGHAAQHEAGDRGVVVLAGELLGGSGHTVTRTGAARAACSARPRSVGSGSTATTSVTVAG